jgi:hypothetical protein
MKFANPHSGKSTFFKGRGRKGKAELDDYQLMLIAQETKNKRWAASPNGFIKKDKSNVHRKRDR